MSISSSGQYLTLQKYFSHPSFNYFLFFNPTHKTKTGTANRWETTKKTTWTNYYDSPIRNREHQSDHIYYTLLRQVLGFVVPFTSISKLCKNAGPKPFCWTKLACFEFSSSNFNLQGHILSTGGVVLSSWSVCKPCKDTHPVGKYTTEYFRKTKFESLHHVQPCLWSWVPAGHTLGRPALTHGRTRTHALHHSQIHQDSCTWWHSQ